MKFQSCIHILFLETLCRCHDAAMLISVSSLCPTAPIYSPKALMARILIVDDTEENLYLLEALLRGHGYEIRTAKNGMEALARTAESRPDLIISDILMPKMDGFALCRHWKADAALKNIPFVFYTATYTDTKDEKFALGLGADMFIVKPTDPDTFAAKIKGVL